MPQKFSDSKSSLTSFDDGISIEELLFNYVNSGNKPQLQELLNNPDCADSILKILLTKIYHNDDNAYCYEEDVLQEAKELLGKSVKNLNMLHVCCMIGDEEIALELLEFLQRITDELESKKLLFEFIGRLWGDGNTVLHLAAFMGLDQLVVKLIGLGANTNKRNERQYRPVDCAADDVMCNAFNTLPPDVSTNRRISRQTDDFIEPNNSLEGPSSPTIKEDDVEIALRCATNSPDKLLDPVVGKKRRSRSVCGIEDMKKKLIFRTPSTTPSILSKSKKGNPGSKVDFDKTSTILFACQYGENDDDSNLTMLKSVTADKNILEGLKTGHQNLTPLHLACAYNQIKVVEYLLSECCVKVNVVDKEGWTPLHSACVEGHNEIVELLGKCQGRTGDKEPRNPEWFYVADGPIILNPLNEDDETPEMLAVDKELDKVVKIMQDLCRKYPPSSVAIHLTGGESEDSISNYDTDSEEDDINNLEDMAKSNKHCPLMRQTSASAPKSQVERRKMSQNLDSHISSSASNSNESFESISGSKAAILTSLNDACCLNVIKSDKVEELKIELEEGATKKPESEQINMHEPVTNTKIALRSSPKLQADLNDDQKITAKESRLSKRMSESIEFLKNVEMKIQNLQLDSQSSMVHLRSAGISTTGKDMSTLSELGSQVISSKEIETKRMSMLKEKDPMRSSYRDLLNSRHVKTNSSVDVSASYSSVAIETKRINSTNHEEKETHQGDSTGIVSSTPTIKTEAVKMDEPSANIGVELNVKNVELKSESLQPLIQQSNSSQILKSTDSLRGKPELILTRDFQKSIAVHKAIYNQGGTLSTRELQRSAAMNKLVQNQGEIMLPRDFQRSIANNKVAPNQDITSSNIKSHAKQKSSADNFSSSVKHAVNLITKTLTGSKDASPTKQDTNKFTPDSKSGIPKSVKTSSILSSEPLMESSSKPELTNPGSNFSLDKTSNESPNRIKESPINSVKEDSLSRMDNFKDGIIKAPKK